MGWVRLGRDFSVFGGLVWVNYSKSTKKFERISLMHEFTAEHHGGFVLAF